MWINSTCSLQESIHTSVMALFMLNKSHNLWILSLDYINPEVASKSTACRIKRILEERGLWKDTYIGLDSARMPTRWEVVVLR